LRYAKFTGSRNRGHHVQRFFVFFQKMRWKQLPNKRSRFFVSICSTNRRTVQHMFFPLRESAHTHIIERDQIPKDLIKIDDIFSVKISAWTNIFLFMKSRQVSTLTVRYKCKETREPHPCSHYNHCSNIFFILTHSLQFREKKTEPIEPEP